MVAAVGRMAGHTILLHRGMLPHVRPPLFRMALVAQFIETAAFDHFRPESAVMIMAIGAFQLSFADGMMRGLILLSADRPMTDIAEVGLLGLQVLPGSRMDGMAVVAGYVGDLVLGHVPEG